MITDLPTNRISAVSQSQTFLRVCTYETAAKINWYRYGTKLSKCHPVNIQICTVIQNVGLTYVSNSALES